MSEQGQWVRTFKVDYICDLCGGEVYNAHVRKSRGFLGQEDTGLRYQHKCRRCHQVHWLSTEYPRFEYAPVEE